MKTQLEIVLQYHAGNGNTMSMGTISGVRITSYPVPLRAQLRSCVRTPEILQWKK